jgi:Collagen triple helix repeat (20 copies)
MIHHYYQAIKKKLESVPADVDYDFGQLLQNGDDTVHRLPLILIKFNPITWRSLPTRIQESDDILIDISIVTSDRYGDDRSINNDITDHQPLCDAVYAALHGSTYRLSDYISNLPPDSDAVILNDLERGVSTHPQQINNLLVTTYRFKAYGWDCTAHVAGIESEFDIVLEYCIGNSPIATQTIWTIRNLSFVLANNQSVPVAFDPLFPLSNVLFPMNVSAGHTVRAKFLNGYGNYTYVAGAWVFNWFEPLANPNDIHHFNLVTGNVPFDINAPTINVTFPPILAGHTLRVKFADGYANYTCTNEWDFDWFESKGSDGSKLLVGTVDPSYPDDLGSEGDYYLYKAPDDEYVMFGPKVGAWAPGYRLIGRTILTGTTVPSNSLGRNGDIYLRTGVMQLYGPKNIVWGAGANLIGANGSPGAAGQAGPPGIQGIAGPQGPIGLTGNDGAAGIAGAIGPQGPAGAQGIQGPTGPAVSDGKQLFIDDNSTTYENADFNALFSQYVINDGDTIRVKHSDGYSCHHKYAFGGVVEDWFESIAGIQGPIGVQGIQGPAGNDGATGATGIQGLQGPLGPKGDQGATGIQGPNGAPGIQGPIGATGIQGPIGAQGIQGPAGDTGPAGIGGVNFFSHIYALPSLNNTTLQLLGIFTAPVMLGTVSSNFISNSKYGIRRKLNCVAASALGAIAGVRAGTQIAVVNNFVSYMFVYEFSYALGASNTQKICFVGLRSNNTAPVANLTPLGILNTENGIAIGHANGDAFFSIYTNNGTSPATAVVTTIPVPVLDQQDIYRVTVTFNHTLLSYTVKLETLINIASDTKVISTDLPLMGTQLYPSGWLSSGSATAAVTFGFFGFELKYL